MKERKRKKEHEGGKCMRRKSVCIEIICDFAVVVVVLVKIDVVKNLLAMCEYVSHPGARNAMNEYGKKQPTEMS